MKFNKILIFAVIAVGLAVALFFVFRPVALVSPKVMGLELMAEGFDAPVKLIGSPDNTGKLFVADQNGTVKIIKDGEVMSEPFLDLRDRMVELKEAYDERGLLGIAFSPEFKNDGKFYVYYSAPLRSSAPAGWDHTSRVSVFTVSADNPDKIDSGSEKILLEIDEPQLNHNGGDIVFGSDGYLYIATGDGGAADDFGLGHPEIGNGQDLSNLLGKILRIKADGSIPSSNPFVGKDGRDEIYAYGFRNPFRMSFDKDDRLFVADVGQNIWEEVDIVEKGGNYGWNIKEGTHCFSHESANESPADCPNEGYLGEELIEPILEYSHEEGISIIGGFVYRGKEVKNWKGNYIFGNWSNSFEAGAGKILMAEEKDGIWSITETKEVGSFVLGFGEDREGELYLLTSDKTGIGGDTGKVYKIVAE